MSKETEKLNDLLAHEEPPWSGCIAFMLILAALAFGARELYMINQTLENDKMCLKITDE